MILKKPHDVLDDDAMADPCTDTFGGGGRPEMEVEIQPTLAEWKSLIIVSCKERGYPIPLKRGSKQKIAVLNARIGVLPLIPMLHNAVTTLTKMLMIQESRTNGIS